MKKTMNNYPIQFVIKIGIVKLSIGPYCINTNIQVPRKDITFTIIKSNNVSEKMMIKRFYVQVQNVRVRTKNYINLTNTAVFDFSYRLKPSACPASCIELEISIF